ncbi:DUF2785 domain-containing protein [Priestia koreensis]|uniref:DUF2785 domain-containing protein n=1 Tax=Priestia koreensis TaxID=284581 RepID=UPI00203EEC8F|nr:DUF2785 domain-containing protein [Priestia koreensis]
MNLKEQLRLLNEEDALSDQCDELIDHMLHHIGSTDAELRDELIYGTFARLIRGGHLENYQLQHMLKTCLDDNHLFYHLSESSGDAVFTRSFSSLVICLLLDQDHQAHFLTKQEIQEITDKSIRYVKEEKDTRGYVEEKGWAHSIAHGADLLASIVEHPSFELTRSEDILLCIQNALFKGTVYTDDEDERLIVIIERLLKKGLEEAVLENWIASLFHHLHIRWEQEARSLAAYRLKTSVMNFARTLYFRLRFYGKGEDAQKQIEQQINHWYNKKA